MTPEVGAFIREFGLPLALLIVAGYTGARGIWRWGREVVAADLRAEAAEKRATEWQAIALKALNVGERVVTTVDQ